MTFRSRGAQIVGVEAERAVEMFQRLRPIGAAAIHFGQRVIAGRGPGLVPGGLVEGRIGFSEKLLSRHRAESPCCRDRTMPPLTSVASAASI